VLKNVALLVSVILAFFILMLVVVVVSGLSAQNFCLPTHRASCNLPGGWCGRSVEWSA